MGSLGPNFNLKQFLQQFQKLGNVGAPGEPTAGAPSGPLGNAMGGGLNTIAANMLFQQMMQMQSNMTPRETALLMRSVMGLPKEIQTILALLASTQSGKTPLDAQTLKQLLAETPDLKISLEELQQTLGKQSQDTANKLLKIIQSNSAAAFTGDSQKMTELLQFTTQLTARVAASPTDAMNTLILLYIPWYPLVGQQRLEMYFEEGGEDGGGQEGADYTLVIYVETNTLGKFKIAAGVAHRTQLMFKIEHDRAAQPHLKAMQKALAETLAEDGIPPPILEFEQREEMTGTPGVLQKHSGVDDFKTLREDSKKVSVYPSKGISVIVLNGAYQLSRIIFEIDERNSLLDKRSRSAP